MISPKQAAQAASNYLKELVSDEELKNLRVEEITRSDDQKHWHVTLGWVESANRTLGVNSAFMNTKQTIEALPRVYRLFPVDVETGEVAAMKMRN